MMVNAFQISVIIQSNEKKRKTPGQKTKDVHLRQAEAVICCFIMDNFVIKHEKKG